MTSTSLFWIIVGVQALICGFLSMSVAEKKGHSSGDWFFAGFFFGVLGLIAAAGLPMYEKQKRQDYTKKCMDCAEEIKAEANVCKYCGKKYSTEEINKTLLEDLKGIMGAEALVLRETGNIVFPLTRLTYTKSQSQQ